MTWMKGMIVTLILMVSLSLSSHGSQITELIKAGIGTPITKTIQHLQPAISWEEANRHAWIIYEEAEKTGLDWKLITAITFQESSFTIMRGDRTCGLTQDGLEACVYRAFGPMHVYWEYWKNSLQLDAKRFVADLRYQYQVGVAILQRRWEAYGHLGFQWIGTYNSTTPRHRDAYAGRVVKHIATINAFLDGQRR